MKILLVITPQNNVNGNLLKLLLIPIDKLATVAAVARPGLGMTFNVVEGSAKVTADGVVQTVHAGAQVLVPMTANTKPNGP